MSFILHFSSPFVPVFVGEPVFELDCLEYSVAP